MALLALEGVSKSYDGRTILDEVDLTLDEGERVGLVGPNGGGKSTLLRMLVAAETPDAGTRTLRRALRLGYLEQEPFVDPALTARAAVRQGFAGRERVLSELEDVHAKLAHAVEPELGRLLARQERLESELENLGGHDVEHRIESTLQGLGFTEFEAECGRLSGGERRRVALARLLCSAPELLLLDEPTNHLDAFAIDWLEDWFLETRTPLLLVTHDRYFLERICDRIVELDRAKLFSYVGGYGDYLEQRAARLSAEARAEATRLNLLRRETAWMRRGPPARTTKAKARIRRYGELVSGEPAPLPDELEVAIPAGPRLGTRVVTLKGVSKRYGERVVVPRLDLELVPGERLGVVGPNGAGKTTLVRMLMGELAPDTGTREAGSTVEIAAVDQLRSQLELDQTVTEALAGKSEVVSFGGRSVRVEGFLDRFGLGIRQQRARVRDLSGGERGRLELARLVTRGGNLLVLDEPTNDLDLAALRALEESLCVFPGTVVIVSHDRWFLDRVATRLLYLDGEGGARVHHGDLSGLIATLAREREERRAAEAAERARKAAAAAPARPAAKAKRLSNWQEKELVELEARIAAEESALAALDASLADPALYSGPKARTLELQRERQAKADALARLYARWEELESLRG